MTSTTSNVVLLEAEVPLEIPAEEYQDLLTQAQELVSSCTSDQERLDVLQEEWLQGARYGDVDVLRALWQTHSPFLLLATNELMDSNGNTALHLASANGHESVVKLLLLLLSSPPPTTTTTTTTGTEDSSSTALSNVRMAMNHSGNTPLHWAAANGHDKILKLLMYFNNGSSHAGGETDDNDYNHQEDLEDAAPMDLNESNDVTPTTTPTTTTTSSTAIFPIDVLQKNHFGRSILTEGFTSQNENVVQLLLEHESASEERFLDSTSDDVGAKLAAAATSATATGGDKMDVDHEDDDEDDDDDDNDSDDDDDIDEDDDEEEGAIIDSTLLLNAVMSALEKDAIIHDFDLLLSASNNTEAAAAAALPSKDASSNTKKALLRIRELPMTGENPLGDTAIEDVTGYGIWCASLILARWMADLVSNNNNIENNNSSSSSSNSDRWKDRTVVELGAGCGVPGLVVACHSQARYVLLTDLNPITVQNLQYNITLNEPLSSTPVACPWSDRVQASTIDWLHRQTWPHPPPLVESQEPQPPQLFDVVLGSDLIYQASTAPMLRNVIAGLLRSGGTFYYVAPSTTGRDGLSEFIESLQQPGATDNDDDDDEDDSSSSRFQLVAATLAPKHYHDNPLCSQDDDDFFLHFHEMSSSQYMLYEFVKL